MRYQLPPVALLVLVSTCMVALVHSASTASEPAIVTDAILQTRVEAAIAKEDDLAALNLMITVVGRVALVGGPIPSLDTVKDLERVIRGVQGLSDVKISCWVPLGTDPLTRKVGERLKASPLQNPPPPLALPSLGVIRSVPPLRMPEPEKQTQPDRVTAQRAVPNLFPGWLLEPVTSRGRQEAAQDLHSGAYPRIPPPGLPTHRETTKQNSELEEYVASVKSRDQRFADLDVTVTKGVARIHGRVSQDADAWEFAAQLRNAPEIQQIILGKVSRK